MFQPLDQLIKISKHFDDALFSSDEGLMSSFLSALAVTVCVPARLPGARGSGSVRMAAQT